MRAFRHSVTAAALTAAALLPLGGCSDVTTQGTSTMSVLLTDAPGDFVKAVVTISEIDLVGASDSDRVVLMNTPVTTDLLTLANNTQSLVENAVVPAGRFTQLRFVITGAYVEIENSDGTTSIYASSPSYEGLPAGATVAGQLIMPSYAQTGLKVSLPNGGVSTSGGQQVVLVDFNVSDSFGQDAGTGQWVMRPAIKASDFQLTGSALIAVSLDSGVTLPVVNGTQVTLADFSAQVTDAAGAVRTVQVSDQGGGAYAADVRLLTPGSASIDLVSPSGVTVTTDPVLPAALSITSGQQAGASIVITWADTTSAS